MKNTFRNVRLKTPEEGMAVTERMDCWWALPVLYNTNDVWLRVFGTLLLEIKQRKPY